VEWLSISIVAFSLFKGTPIQRQRCHSTRGQAQIASFKCITVNYWWSEGILLRRE
jgi:hypothetical protein